MIEYPLFLCLVFLASRSGTAQARAGVGRFTDRGIVLAASRLRLPVVITSLLGVLVLIGQATPLHSERTPSSARCVKEVDGGVQRVLMHGTTDHGRQDVGPALRRVPLTYYAASGPVADVFRLRGGCATQVGLIGLGVGTLAAYGRPGQRCTFFEIDPSVVEIARDASYFTYLQDSRADVRVVVGDGRLASKPVRDGIFDLFVVDAFSSDVIPTHL